MTHTNRFGTLSELGPDGICRAVRPVEMPPQLILNERFGSDLNPYQQASRDDYSQAEEKWGA